MSGPPSSGSSATRKSSRSKPANLKPDSPEPSAKDRVVRVFISSTFRDMFRERDILVKRIFPQLRKLCEERFVTWGEVDRHG